MLFFRSEPLNMAALPQPEDHFKSKQVLSILNLILCHLQCISNPDWLLRDFRRVFQRRKTGRPYVRENCAFLFETAA